MRIPTHARVRSNRAPRAPSNPQAQLGGAAAGELLMNLTLFDPKELARRTALKAKQYRRKWARTRTKMQLVRSMMKKSKKGDAGGAANGVNPHKAAAQALKAQSREQQSAKNNDPQVTPRDIYSDRMLDRAPTVPDRRRNRPGNGDDKSNAAAADAGNKCWCW